MQAPRRFCSGKAAIVPRPHCTPPGTVNGPGALRFSRALQGGDSLTRISHQTVRSLWGASWRTEMQAPRRFCSGKAAIVPRPHCTPPGAVKGPGALRFSRALQGSDSLTRLSRQLVRSLWGQAGERGCVLPAGFALEKQQSSRARTARRRARSRARERSGSLELFKGATV